MADMSTKIIEEKNEDCEVLSVVAQQNFYIVNFYESGFFSWIQNLSG